MKYREKYEQWRSNVDGFLAELSPEELSELREDVAARSTAFANDDTRDMFRKLPITHGWVKTEIYHWVKNLPRSSYKSAHPREQSVASATVAEDFEV